MILLGVECYSVLIITFNDCEVPWETLMKIARLHFYYKFSFPIHRVRIKKMCLNTQRTEIIA